MLKKTLILALVLLGMMIPVSIQAQQVSSIIISIDTTGVVYVNITGVAQPGLNFYSCPVEPIPQSLEVLLGNVSIPVIYHNNTVIVPANTTSNVLITYVANTTIAGDTISFYFNSSLPALLRVPPNIVVLSLPENISSIDVVDNTLIIEFQGYGLVSYIVSTIAPTETTTTTTTTTPPLVTTTTTTTTQQETTTTTQQPGQTTTTTTTTPQKTKNWLPYILAILAIVAVAGLALYFTKRGSEESGTLIANISSTLDDVDKAILEKLKESGGELLQSVLYKELNYPKTTIWRHVNKLERLGLVSVERVGGVNKVRLLKG